jgi:hypothetical protein
MLASLKACSIASMDGLHRIGDFGSSTPGTGSARYFIISKISPPFAGGTGADDAGFSVSKHRTPSKQSSIPSLFRALEVWILSPFVKT